MPKPFSNMRKRWFKVVLVFILIFWGTTPVLSFKWQFKSFGVAIAGYDTVAYHTERRAVKGKSEFSHEWNDVDWHFASAEHRDLFARNPERYAPQFGGYCAGALAEGGIVPPDPEIFKIIDGKLYLAGSTKNLKILKSQNAVKQAHKEWAKFNK